MAKIMKRLAVLLVLMIFVLSVLQSVNAQTDKENPLKRKIVAFAELDEKIDEKIEQQQDNVEKAREKLEEVRDRVKTVREEYNTAKERYEKVKEEYELKKSEISELRNKVKNCREDEDCELKKKNLRKGVKLHLVKTIEVMEKSLEKLTNRVEDSNVLTDEEKENALMAIVELEEKLTVKKDNLLEVADELSAEELREEIRELKDLWHDVRKLQRRIVAKLISSKQDNLVEKHQEYINAMELRIDELAEQGVDVTELQNLLNSFKRHLESLEKNRDEAGSLIEDLEIGKEVFEQWRRSDKKVRDDLSDSKDILRDFLKSYRDSQKDIREKLEVEREERTSEERVKEKTKAEIDGNVDLSAEADALLEDLLESLTDVDGEVKLKLKVVNDDGEVKVDTRVNGRLNDQQENIWHDLVAAARSLVEDSESGDELEIEVKHELEKKVVDERDDDHPENETDDVEMEEDEESGHDDSEDSPLNDSDDDSDLRLETTGEE